MRYSVPFHFIYSLAAEFGAVECLWRESERSFTGFVAEVWFRELPSEFATCWAQAVGYPVKVASVTTGPGRFVARVPVEGVHGQVKLGWASRGSRVWLLP